MSTGTEIASADTTGAAHGSAAASSAVVEVRDLVYDYPTGRALFGVSLDIEPGTITAFVGPNGAGKTTLMRCIAALETPFSGRVTVDGLNVEDHPRAVHRRMGFLQDFFGLYDELSVRRCLDYYAAVHGVPAAARPAAVERSAAQLGLSDRLSQQAGTLSRGLRQRLAIAQTIIHRPNLLLLDEPASGLDPEARQDLSELLLALRDDGMTLVVSSHILAELEDYSSHMLMIRDGRIVDHFRVGQKEDIVKTRLVVSLTRDDPRLRDMLSGADGVSGIVAQDNSAGFDFAGDADAQAALLRMLVDGGLPVCGFHAMKRSMQDVYMHRMQTGRSGADTGEDQP